MSPRPTVAFKTAHFSGTITACEADRDGFPMRIDLKTVVDGDPCVHRGARAEVSIGCCFARFDDGSRRWMCGPFTIVSEKCHEGMSVLSARDRSGTFALLIDEAEAWLAAATEPLKLLRVYVLGEMLEKAVAAEAAALAETNRIRSALMEIA